MVLVVDPVVSAAILLLLQTLPRNRPRSVQPPIVPAQAQPQAQLGLRANQGRPRRTPSVLGVTAVGVIPVPFAAYRSERRVPRSGTTTRRPPPPGSEARARVRPTEVVEPLPLLSLPPPLPRKLQPTTKDPSCQRNRSCPPILPYRFGSRGARRVPRILRLQLQLLYLVVAGSLSRQVDGHRIVPVPMVMMVYSSPQRIQRLEAKPARCRRSAFFVTSTPSQLQRRRRNYFFQLLLLQLLQERQLPQLLLLRVVRLFYLVGQQRQHQHPLLPPLGILIRRMIKRRWGQQVLPRQEEVDSLSLPQLHRVRLASPLRPPRRMTRPRRLPLLASALALAPLRLRRLRRLLLLLLLQQRPHLKKRMKSHPSALEALPQPL